MRTFWEHWISGNILWELGIVVFGNTYISFYFMGKRNMYSTNILRTFWDHSENILLNTNTVYFIWRKKWKEKRDISDSLNITRCNILKLFQECCNIVYIICTSFSLSLSLSLQNLSILWQILWDLLIVNIRRAFSTRTWFTIYEHYQDFPKIAHYRMECDRLIGLLDDKVESYNLSIHQSTICYAFP